MRVEWTTRKALALCVTGLLGLGGCGPGEGEGAGEPAEAPAQTQQAILGYYVSFNGDLPSDLVWRNQSSGANFVWRTNGPSVVGTSALPGLSPFYTIQAASNFGGASIDPDLIIQSASPGGENALFLNSAFSITGSAALAPLPSADWYFAASGDFNGDSHADLLLHNRVTGQWFYRYMNGPALVGTSAVFTRPIPWYPVGAGDMNMDNRPDILWRNRSTGQNEVTVMNNAAVIGVAALPTQSLAFYVGATADYTLDRRTDIVWHNPSTGQVLLWTMNGTTLAGTTTLGGMSGGCPAWFSQVTPPPASANCNYLVGPR